MSDETVVDATSGLAVAVTSSEAGRVVAHRTDWRSGLAVGRTVHYVPEEAGWWSQGIAPHLAATVNEVPEGDGGFVGLTVFPRTSMATPPYTVMARHAASGTPGTWHWPEFV